MRFGQRIRELRMDKGLSQRALGKLVGVSFTYISKVENHQLDFGEYPSEALIRKAAKALQKGDDPNLCLSIEKLDDVAFHESPSSPSVARECLQFKHKINRAGGLGDSSPDIWKTLKIWAEAIKNKRIDLDRTSLFLVTT